MGPTLGIIQDVQAASEMEGQRMARLGSSPPSGRLAHILPARHRQIPNSVGENWLSENPLLSPAPPGPSGERGCLPGGGEAQPHVRLASSPLLLSLASLENKSSGFFFFFINTFSKQLLQQIAADGPAGCGRGWQLPSAGAWPLSSSRSTKISSPCSPSEDAAYRGSGRPGHVWLGALSAQRKPPWFPFLFCLLSRANKCF